jgi:hypothetical protein
MASMRDAFCVFLSVSLFCDPSVRLMLNLKLKTKKLDIYPTARKVTKNTKKRFVRTASSIIKIKKKEIIITEPLFTLESVVQLRNAKIGMATSFISRCEGDYRYF